MDIFLFFAALIFGAGLAIDVSIATLARFQDKSLTLLSWTIPIVVLHIIGLSGSYLLSLGTARQFPALQPVIGVFGFLLVMWLVNKVTKEALGHEHSSRLMDWLERQGISDHSASRVIVAVALSIDAAVGGPVIEPWISNLNNLSDLAVFFLAVGVGVGVVTHIAVSLADRLRNRRFNSPEKMARWFAWAKYIELSVIGGFGISAPWQSIWGNSNLYVSIMIMAVMMGFIWIRNYQVIFAVELKKAKEAITG